MRALCVAILASFVAFSATSSGESPYLKGEELKAKIALECQEGCVTFNSEQATEFEQQLQVLLAQKMAEAFKAGVEYQKQACASLVSL